MRAVLTCILAVMFFATLLCEAQNSSNSTPAKNAKSEKKTSLETCLISGNQEFYDKFKEQNWTLITHMSIKYQTTERKYPFTLKEKIIYCTVFSGNV